MRNLDILVRSKYLITDPSLKEAGIINNGGIYISEGRIAEVGDFDSLKMKYPNVEIKGNGKQLAIPGIIDGHSHGQGLSYIQRGVLYDFLENSLIDWAFAPDIDPELNTMLNAVRHIKNGCTTIHHNDWGNALDSKAMEKAEKKIRGYKKVGARIAYSPGVRNMNTLAYDDIEFFKTLPSDLQDFARPMVFYDKSAAIEEYMELFERLYHKYNNNNTRIIFGPSWVQGSTDEFLIRVKEKADKLGKLPIHIHTLQTPIQKAFGIRKYRKSLLAHLDDIGLVDENLVLGHAVYLNETDIELLAFHKASTTHHPSCNLAVRNGISPVYYLNKAGVNVSLGIDGKGINDDEDCIMELRMIYYLHRTSGFDLDSTPPLNSFDVLKMGTINAARVCGFDGELGSIKPGMKADIVLIDLNKIMDDPWQSPNLNIADIFIHRCKGSYVNTVIIGGEIIMENRKIVTIDVELLYKEVRKQISKGLSKKQVRYAQRLQEIKPYLQKWYKNWTDLEYKSFYIMNSIK